MLCGLQKSIVWPLLAMTVIAGARFYEQTSTAKISTLTLENYGWQPLPKGQHGEWPGTSSRLVWFDHEDRVLVGFSARESTDLATRDRPGLSLHILRFTHDGKLDLSLVLPTKDYFANGLYLGPNDQVLARANESLQILIGENQDPQTLAWKVLASCSDNCRIHQSQSRRTLIISESQDGLGHSSAWPTADSSYTIIDLSVPAPAVLRTCSQIAFYAEIITDKFAYWPSYDTHNKMTVRLPFCDVDHPQELALGRGGILVPLNDDAFLLLGPMGKDSRGGVKLVGSDGRVKFRSELPKHDTPSHYAGDWAASDERGDRFAFTVETWRGGSRALDISGKKTARRVVVYSETGQELASVPVSTMYPVISTSP
jgi:hypothetical protein